MNKCDHKWIVVDNGIVLTPRLRVEDSPDYMVISRGSYVRFCCPECSEMRKIDLKPFYTQEEENAYYDERYEIFEKERAERAKKLDRNLLLRGISRYSSFYPKWLKNKLNKDVSINDSNEEGAESE